ncbi:MAG: hypothetical protein IIC92_07660 [Chloroflexi bacterium]|nr:hypothetical protein [Chloroflexota bacterium]
MAYIDPVEVSPDVYTVLFENDAVRVLDMTLPAGQSDVEHSHTAETVIFLKGGKAHIALPDGDAMDAELPDCHIMWHEAWTHTVTNTGDTEIKAIIVESKG